MNAATNEGTWFGSEPVNRHCQWLDIAEALRRIGASEPVPVHMTAKVMRRVREEAAENADPGVVTLVPRHSDTLERVVARSFADERTSADRVDPTGPRPGPPTRMHRMASKRSSSARREALRLGRLAATTGRRYSFLLEHGLLDEARRTRMLMLRILRDARSQWRTAAEQAPSGSHPRT
jgi:hypothetical protein